MLKIALLFILLCASAAHAAETLPDAPISQPVFHRLDLTIAASVYATHVADYRSTMQCIHGVRCREVILDQGLVHRNGLFAAYEFGTATLEGFGQYELTKHNHRRLARVAQLANIYFTARTVANNEELNWTTPRPRGLILVAHK